MINEQQMRHHIEHKFIKPAIIEVLDLVCSDLGVTPRMLNSRSKKSELAFARQVAHYCVRERTGASLEMVGKYVGKRNHCTVINSIRRVQAAIDGFDPDLKRVYDRVKDRPKGLLT